MAMRSMALKASRGGPGRFGHIFLFCKKASAYINVLFTYDIHRFIYILHNLE